MAKKQRTHEETLMDWFSESVWGTLLKEDIRLRKLIVKGGLADWLIVVSVVRDDEYQVAFIGAPTLMIAIKKLHKELLDGTVSWRLDQYPPE